MGESIWYQGVIFMVKEGEICSEEHKRHVSEALKGRIISPEHAAKISQALKGKKKNYTGGYNAVNR